MHGNNVQMRLCIVKLGVVSSIYGDFWGGVGVEMLVRTILPRVGFIKGFLCRFWHTHAFINLKTFVRMRFCAYVNF